MAERFCTQFPLPPEKIKHLDYGFDRKRLSDRRRVADGKFIFGYIGTHTPGKGVHHLLEAFGQVAAKRENCELHIWGRLTDNTKYLKSNVADIPTVVRDRIKWRGEYANTNIVRDVFNHIDSVIVPSIWEENSPLVIHEAQQVRLPVITAGMGGMAEYVRHGENGLLFAPREPKDMAIQMEKFIADPDWASKLGRRGYLYGDNGDVPDIGEHVLAIENLYRRVISERNDTRVDTMSVPWRITFDTNPDHCNYHCTMCEEHSPYSPLQFQRRTAGYAKRVMSFDMIARNVEAMAKIGLREIIPSTMGETIVI